ncbi:MAG: hypothetical protein RLP09_03845 [Sandaracinaceae bacterium]
MHAVRADGARAQVRVDRADPGEAPEPPEPGSGVAVVAVEHGRLEHEGRGHHGLGAQAEEQPSRVLLRREGRGHERGLVQQPGAEGVEAQAAQIDPAAHRVERDARAPGRRADQTLMTPSDLLPPDAEPALVERDLAERLEEIGRGGELSGLAEAARVSQHEHRAEHAPARVGPRPDPVLDPEAIEVVDDGLVEAELVLVVAQPDLAALPHPQDRREPELAFADHVLLRARPALRRLGVRGAGGAEGEEQRGEAHAADHSSGDGRFGNSPRVSYAVRGRADVRDRQPV